MLGMVAIGALATAVVAVPPAALGGWLGRRWRSRDRLPP
jgi:hypothetical protein